MNQVVIHTKAGQVLKGVTNNFMPGKDSFHLMAAGTAPGTKPTEILLNTLKAVFFVRDLKGRPEHKEAKAFDPSMPLGGKKMRVVFQDGEVLLGTTQGYQPGRPGFFLVPADPRSNNERCFVISSATREITLL